MKNTNPETLESSRHHIRIPKSSPNPNSTSEVSLDTALQYGSAQGYPPLYMKLKRLVNCVYHPNIPYEGGAEIMINGGSADGLSKVFELLFNHWDRGAHDVQERQGLLVEEFLYAPPIAQVKPRDVNIVPVKMDAEGILAYGPGSLFDVLEYWDFANGKRPQVLLVIPYVLNRAESIQSN
jgi:DNA-binding transcriptional MocR family regulator